MTTKKISMPKKEKIPKKEKKKGTYDPRNKLNDLTSTE